MLSQHRLSQLIITYTQPHICLHCKKMNTHKMLPQLTEPHLEVKNRYILRML